MNPEWELDEDEIKALIKILSKPSKPLKYKYIDKSGNLKKGLKFRLVKNDEVIDDAKKPK